MKKINATDLWILIRLHLIYTIIIHHKNLVMLLEISSYEVTKKEVMIAHRIKLALESLTAIKSLAIPKEIIDYCLAVESNNRWFQPVGDLKYNGTFGFFTGMFTSHEKMLAYIHNRLSPAVELHYGADNETGIRIASGGEMILNVSINNEIVYFDNNRSTGFLLFLNNLFGAGTMPNEEQFEKVDIALLLNE